MNIMRGGFQQATMLPASLSFESARAAVVALEIIGLPAALLTAQGKVIDCNALLDDLRAVIIPTGLGGLALVPGATNMLFRAALDNLASMEKSEVQSIPLPGNEGKSWLIAHLLPVKALDRGVLSGGEVLLVVTPIGQLCLPGISLLQDVFGLTPAEARIVRHLMMGQTVAGIAEAQRVSVTTLRSQLSSIFAKTGTSRQAELLSLIASMQARHPGRVAR